MTATSARDLVSSLPAIGLGAVRSAWADADRRFSIAIAIAFLTHAMIIAVATGMLHLALPLWLVPAPPQQPAPIGAGDPSGTPDGINVESIDATEFDRRYIAFTPGRDTADTEPVEAGAANPTPPQPKQAQTEQKQPEKQQAEPKKTDPEPPPPPEPGEQRPQPSKALTQADLAEILAATRLDADRVVQLTSKAGGARLGEASPFVRAVLRKLKEAMPHPTGRAMLGTLVVQFIVSDTGDVEFIRLAQSSNNPALDRLVLERVRSTGYPVPDKTTPARDRAFNITYEYN